MEELPVLIFFSKPGCPACLLFKPHWEELRSRLHGRANMVRFECETPDKIPPAFRHFIQYYPTILLAGPYSYYRIYTKDGKINQVDDNANYKIKAKKWGIIESTGEYEGVAPTAGNVMNFFEAWQNRIKSFDEPTPPKNFSRNPYSRSFY